MIFLTPQGATNFSMLFPFRENVNFRKNKFRWNPVLNVRPPKPVCQFALLTVSTIIENYPFFSSFIRYTVNPLKIQFS